MPLSKSTKKITLIISILLILFITILIIFRYEILNTTRRALPMPYRVSGMILLDINSNGEAWYVNPDNKQKYYLGNPDQAYTVMKELSITINEDNLNKYLKKSFPIKYSGKFIQDNQQENKIYYINVDDKKGYPIQNPDEAFALIQKMALGVRNGDSRWSIEKIEPNPNYNIEETFHEVIKIIDGDTIVVAINGVNEKIRLIGIDTPEIGDTHENNECFATQATNKAKKLLTNQKVKLEADSSQADRDTYNRLLRFVFLEDGTNFNELMIQEGFAYEYTYDKPYKYQKEFQETQQKAKIYKNGFWDDGVCDNKPHLE